MKAFAKIIAVAAFAAAAIGISTPSEAGLFSAFQPKPTVVAKISLSQQKLYLNVTDNRGHRTSYVWNVSTGAAGYDTPKGHYRPTWLDKDHKSSQYEDAPMPYSVFFVDGIAVHGTQATAKLGQRASETVDVLFDEVRLRDQQILGAPGGGFAIAMETFDKSRPMIGAQCAGIIRRCLDESIRYAKERKTFGVAIAQHQAIQFMIAEMAMAYETVKLLYSKAGWEIDNGIRRTNTSAIAKCMGADLAVKSATDAVQIFGGYGYTREYPVEKLYRDSKLMQIYEGTSQVQRMVIAKNLLVRA